MSAEHFIELTAITLGVLALGWCQARELRPVLRYDHITWLRAAGSDPAAGPAGGQAGQRR